MKKRLFFVFCPPSPFSVSPLDGRVCQSARKAQKNEKTKKLSFFAGGTVCHTCLKVYVDETNDHPFEYNFQTLFFTLSSAHGGDSIHTHEREGERINDARVYIGNTSEEEEQEERVSRNVQERERSRE